MYPLASNSRGIDTTLLFPTRRTLTIFIATSIYADIRLPNGRLAAAKVQEPKRAARAHYSSWMEFARRGGVAPAAAIHGRQAVVAEALAQGHTPDATVDEVGAAPDNVGFDGVQSARRPATDMGLGIQRGLGGPAGACSFAERSPLLRPVDIVHRPAAASAYWSWAGIGSASAARPGAASKGSAKYWVSCVTRPSLISMMLTECVGTPS